MVCNRMEVLCSQNGSDREWKCTEWNYTEWKSVWSAILFIAPVTVGLILRGLKGLLIVRLFLLKSHSRKEVHMLKY